MSTTMLVIQDKYQEKLKKLLEVCERNLKNFNSDLITRAFHFSYNAHKDNYRASGEPYFNHPYEVAMIVAKELPLDDISVASALLHDIVEDTSFTIEDIQAEFGDKIARIVDGLTKITGIFESDNRNVVEAENYRKLLIALSTDVRVILVKFADRLHNMRTLEYLPEHKRKRIAKETLEIYAPLAHRFGLGENLELRKKIAPKGEKILIHVSNFRKVKRVQDVVKVFEIVRKKIPSKLVFVGDGPERGDAENLCRQLNICDDVLFLGKQDALHEILCSADVFILPSQIESFGLSALEAMSCGLPVIATNVGGLPEVVLHGETGYLTEIGNIERMASYVIELFEDKNKYREFSEKARERAEKFFDKDLIVPKYEMFYEKILNQ